jgi:hypothetical protein
MQREPLSSGCLDLPQKTPPGNASPPLLPRKSSPPGELRTPFLAEEPLEETEDSSPPLRVNRRGRQNAMQGGVRTTGMGAPPCHRDLDHDMEGGVRTGADFAPCGIDLGLRPLQTDFGSSAWLQNDRAETGLEADNHSRETGSELGLISGLERNTMLASERFPDPTSDGGGLLGGLTPNRKRLLDSAQLGGRGSGGELHVSSALPLSAQRGFGQDSAEDRQTSPPAKRGVSVDGSGLRGVGEADERVGEVRMSGGLKPLENGPPKREAGFWNDDKGSRGANEIEDATRGFERASEASGSVWDYEGGFRANQGFGSGQPMGLLCEDSLVKGRERLGVKATAQVSDPGVSGGGRNGNGFGLIRPTTVSGNGSGMKVLDVLGGNAIPLRNESVNRGGEGSGSGKTEASECSQQSSAGMHNKREEGSTAQILRRRNLQNGNSLLVEAAELLGMGTEEGFKEGLGNRKGEKTENREAGGQVGGSSLAVDNSDRSEPFRETYSFGRLVSKNGLDVSELPGVLAKTLKPCGLYPLALSDHFQESDESRPQKSRPEILNPGGQANTSQDRSVNPKISSQSNPFGESYLRKEPIAALAQNANRPDNPNPAANPGLFTNNETATEAENLKRPQSPNLPSEPKPSSANGFVTNAENGPMSEAERLQEEGHTGAILSMLGGEVEILIDAFGIWWEEDQVYYTAKAVDYNPETHRHMVRFFVDRKEEWVPLWREEVKILQEREDYSGPEDIPLFLKRNGKRGLPERGQKVSKIENGGPAGNGSREKGDQPEKARACTPTGISDELDESEVDDELALEGGDVSANVIVPDGQLAARAGRVNRSLGQFPEEEWKGAVKNGPRTFHFLFENVANANKGQAGVGPDGGLLERENVWEFMQRHLWGIPPEAINSVEFSVAHRKRKWVFF